MKKFSRIVSLLIALMMVMTVVLVACDNSPEDPTGVTVILNRPEANIEVGETLTLTATVSNGSAVTWSTSNAAVATVSGGIVTGVSKGTATITATAGEASASCAVTVRAKGEAITKLPKTYVDDGKNYTYNDYLSYSPSNWNEMDYSDANDTAIINYIGSSFFTFDYRFANGKKFKDDGSINLEGIEEGYVVKYDAATAIKDVTAQYAEPWGLTAAQVASGGYAWQITLRHDLAWDDGTPIKAADFVYSMQEQLNPLFQPLRADMYYNNMVKIVNARNYYDSGRPIWELNCTEDEEEELNIVFELSDLVKGADGIYTYNGHPVRITIGDALDYLGGDTLAFYAEYDKSNEKGWFDLEAYEKLAALCDKFGRCAVTDESLGLLTKMISTDGWEEGEEDTVVYMIYAEETQKEISFDKVGIFAAGEYDIVIVLDNPLSFLEKDGSLSWTAPYYLGSLPLVKKDLYESCKHEPQLGSDLWTTTYNTTLATSASWGPYKLASFQTGRECVLDRNEYWYNYAEEDYKGQYLTDRIVYTNIAEEEAARIAFWSGKIDGLTIDTSISADYRNSDYAVFSPGSGTYGIQIIGDLALLKTNGRNNGVLAIKDFRMALSLGLNRVDFNAQNFTAEQPCLGLIGPAYLYDVPNGLSYRNSEQGKKALLKAYGFYIDEATGKWTDGTDIYADIDEATDAMTGFNLTLARAKLEAAYEELIANAETYGYDPSKKIEILMGNPDGSTKYQKRYDWCKAWIEDLIAGTSFEGKIEFNFSKTLGSKWSDEFKVNTVDLFCLAGFQGNPFNPFNIIGDHINEGSLSYHTYFKATDMLTLTLPAGDYECAGETVTLSARDWFHSLNGNVSEGASHNWSEGFASTEARLEILALLEEYALTHYYSIMTTSEYSAALHSAKWDYASNDYNTMMGFGGIQYMKYNYTDSEWEAFVKDHNNDLSNLYKTSTQG